jgi:hypothetical protein
LRVLDLKLQSNLADHAGLAVGLLVIGILMSVIT